MSEKGGTVLTTALPLPSTCRPLCPAICLSLWVPHVAWLNGTLLGGRHGDIHHLCFTTMANGL